MIKNLWKKFVNWLFSWQKKEDAEEVAPVKIDHCGTHLWYKKSCPECRKAIK